METYRSPHILTTGCKLASVNKNGRRIRDCNCVDVLRFRLLHDLFWKLVQIDVAVSINQRWHSLLHVSRSSTQEAFNFHQSPSKHFGQPTQFRRLNRTRTKDFTRDLKGRHVPQSSDRYKEGTLVVSRRLVGLDVGPQHIGIARFVVQADGVQRNTPNDAGDTITAMLPDRAAMESTGLRT